MMTAEVKRRGFKEALAYEREKIGLSANELASRCHVSRKVYDSWEDGTGLPSSMEFKRLVGSVRAMRFFPPDRSREVVAIVSEVPPAPVVANAPLAATFGEALTLERIAEDLSRNELAEIMDVAPNAVFEWERDGTAPVLEHYERLIELFPRLAGAPKPPTRDIPKPRGREGLGGLSLVPAPASEPRATTPVVAEPEPAHESSEALVRRVADLVTKVFDVRDAGVLVLFVGGGWEVSIVRPDEEQPFVGPVSAPTLDDALKHMLATVAASLDARITAKRREVAELEALRAQTTRLP